MKQLLLRCTRLLVALGLLLATAGATRAQTTTFAYTGANQTYTVPVGVTRLSVVATGGSGGLYTSTSTNYSYGGRAQATLTVVPGEVLTVVVGGQGKLSTSGGGTAAGGFNGGGNGDNAAGYSGGGGGATDLRRTGTSTGDYLASRNALLVAGGSGGNDDNYTTGGNGGTPNGGNIINYNGTVLTGTGATQTAPGGGNSPGVNGTGGSSLTDGGGGGGGYYGGSGYSATSYGGGGGGSSWVMPTGSSAISYSLATTIGNGSLAITPGPTLLSISPTSGPVGTSVTLTGTSLLGATAVIFNGTAATTFAVVNATTVTATVPTGATTGLVTVITPGGTATGVSFTVTIPLATVTTATPATITSSSAVLGGTVTAIGGAAVTERGVVYSATNALPTTADTKLANGSGLGSFSQPSSGLAAGTLYYVRAYATNSGGTAYGSVVSFSTTTGLATTPSSSSALLALYPNPATRLLTLELPPALAGQPATVVLTDALGQVARTQVLPAGSAVRTLSVVGLAPGLYLLHLSAPAAPGAAPSTLPAQRLSVE